MPGSGLDSVIDRAMRLLVLARGLVLAKQNSVFHLRAYSNSKAAVISICIFVSVCA